jgi:hypothetical protein
MLQPSSQTGKKYTVILPPDLVERAVEITGGSVRHAIEQSLQDMMHARACDRMLAMRGKLDPQIDLAALRDDD